jgi:hypothetical protein
VRVIETGRPVSLVAFRPDGRRLLAALNRRPAPGAIVWLDPATGRVSRPRRTGFESVAVSADGSVMAW